MVKNKIKTNPFVQRKGDFYIMFNTLVLCETRASSITIPDGITEIESAAFKKCRHLKQIIIPVSVTCIAANAFTGCKRIKVLRYLGTRAQKEKIRRGMFLLATFYEPPWICEGEKE